MINLSDLSSINFDAKGISTQFVQRVSLILPSSNKRYFIFTKRVIQTFDRGNIGGDLTSGKGNRIETQLYYQ